MVCIILKLYQILGLRKAECPKYFNSIAGKFTPFQSKNTNCIVSEDAIYILSTEVHFDKSPIVYNQFLYKVLYGKVMGKITIRSKNLALFDVAYVKNDHLILVDRDKKVC